MHNDSGRNRSWEMLLIDFDGVISKNSVSVFLDVYHDAINEFIPTPFEISKEQMKSTICLPADSLQQAIALSFRSLGLEDKTDTYFSVFQQMLSQKMSQIKIEPSFFTFADWCCQNEVDFRIFSLADPRFLHVEEVIRRVGEDRFFQLNGRSKESLTTYVDVCKELDVSAEKCLLLDDACQALRSAKVSGLTTVMMTNDVFDETDFALWHKFIDYKVDSFEGFKDIVLV